jgi:hypothetical protein
MLLSLATPKLPGLVVQNVSAHLLPGQFRKEPWNEFLQRLRVPLELRLKLGDRQRGAEEPQTVSKP